MLFLKTLLGRSIRIESDAGTTPRHILNALARSSGSDENQFKMIIMGKAIEGEDLNKTCRALGWEMTTVVHLIIPRGTGLIPDIIHAKSELFAPEPELAGAGFRP